MEVEKALLVEEHFLSTGECSTSMIVSGYAVCLTYNLPHEGFASPIARARVLPCQDSHPYVVENVLLRPPSLVD